jgi:hypothetical protein
LELENEPKLPKELDESEMKVLATREPCHSRDDRRLVIWLSLTGLELMHERGLHSGLRRGVNVVSMSTLGSDEAAFEIDNARYC